MSAIYLRRKLYQLTISFIIACHPSVRLPVEEKQPPQSKEETIKSSPKQSLTSCKQKKKSLMLYSSELISLTSSPTYSKASYAQPLSNPQRNSFVISPLCVQPEIRWSFEVPLRPMDVHDLIRWILTSRHDEQILVTDIENYWLIDRTSKTVLADDQNHSRSFPCFLNDGERFAYFIGAGASLANPKIPQDVENHARVWFPSFGSQTALHAFIPLEENLIGLVQNYGNRGNSLHRSALVFRKPYERDLRTIKWEYYLPEESFPSPALLDGTVVMHLANRLHLVSPEGKLTQEILIQLDPGNVSVDLGNRIWGFARHEQILSLVGFSSQGTQLFQTDLSLKTPVQPPVAFADGRICAITKEGIACILDGTLQWQQTLPEQVEPFLATATADGFLLVVAGSTLFCYDPAGKLAWQVSSPKNDRITSNPAVTADGNVCFATGREIHCLEHL